MGINTYTKVLGNTPVTEKLKGKSQVENNAGGFVFEASKSSLLDRFLILGTVGGSYYAGERDLTKENLSFIEDLILEDGVSVVKRVETISHEGRAPKNDQAIFVLAMCMKLGDDETRKAASLAFGNIVRIGTHLFQAANAVDSLGGWGRGTKRAFTNWYNSHDVDELAVQLVKYQSREKWSHRDLLRKLHISPKNDQYAKLFKWAVGKSSESEISELPGFVKGFEEAKINKDNAKLVSKLVEKYSLTRECVPTESLNSTLVWESLLYAGEGMPLTALIRNLGKMTSIGLLSPGSDHVRNVVQRITNEDAIKKARVHPMTILIAERTYASGKGVKGSLSWSPDRKIVEALNEAFYKSFKFVKPTGKRIMIAMDVSGSMHGGSVAGTNLTPAEASVALALVALNTEKDVDIFGFGTTFQKLPISKNDSLSSAIKKISNINFGRTDCSLPMSYSQSHNMKYDAFYVYTDSETWQGAHASETLKQYRKTSGINAKLVVVGMVSNKFSIADPADPGMLDVVGFDSATPQIMTEFIR